MKKYVCSECGYSNTNAESVVKHIDNKHKHNPLARVYSYETDEENEPLSAFQEVIERFKEFLK